MWWWGGNVATARLFEATADTSGQIAIALQRVASDPKISGIEVRPQIRYKFNVGGSRSGTFDDDHTDYLTNAAGATMRTTDKTITRPSGAPAVPDAPEAVYRSARETVEYGSMTYALAGLMPDKLYRVRLHFADFNEDPTHKRKFEIRINGSLVFTFDQSHPLQTKVPLTAFIRELTFSADAAGRLEIKFKSLDRPAISAVEVEREVPAAGYFANDIGMQVRLGAGFMPTNVTADDGGASALIGSNMVWA